MEKTKHTPGKWEVLEQPSGSYKKKYSIIVIHGHPLFETETICRIIAKNKRWNWEEHEGNAKLIAAAPETKANETELLKTLQELTGGIANQIKHDEISPANVILYKNALKVIERATHER